MREPEKTLPRSLLAATLTVVVLYVCLNAVFLYTTPMDRMAGQLDIALIAGRQIFGEAGGRIVAALICIGKVQIEAPIMMVTGTQPVTSVEGGSMVRTRTTTTRRRAVKPPRASALPVAPVVRPAAEFRAKLEAAGGRAQLAGCTARRWRTLRPAINSGRPSDGPLCDRSGQGNL